MSVAHGAVRASAGTARSHPSRQGVGRGGRVGRSSRRIAVTVGPFPSPRRVAARAARRPRARGAGRRWLDRASIGPLGAHEAAAVATAARNLAGGGPPRAPSRRSPPRPTAAMSPTRRLEPAGSRANPAVRAEPRGVGTSGARDPLAREVKLLGALLGQVIVEQGGAELLDLVERTRRRTIALRRQDDPVGAGAASAEELDSLDLGRTEALIRAFGLYFQLVNLAEEQQRVRTLRQRARTAPDGFLDESIAEAVRATSPRSGRGSAEIVGLPGAAADPAGPDRAPDRGAPADAARRAAALLPAARAARRPAPHARRGPRPPAPTARGDQPPVAHVGAARPWRRRRSTRSAPR